MSLFWAEHQKLWRAGLTRLATGLFLALLTALQLWSYQSANYGSTAPQTSANARPTRGSGRF